MCRILIFGGTTEGRLLAEYCMQQEIAVCVSVVSGYGADLLPESRLIHVVSGRMEEKEMEEFMSRESIRTVFDATHPYAVEATGNIREACKRSGASYVRVTRESAAENGGGGREASASQTVYVDSASEAARY